ncbi:DUF2752 domain-containing protein [Flavobacterium sp.]|uniref:DUF2752 domain-containing protein n=1 Tax=Flavobacterium sp. TaxID=239 RepID=UPI00286DCB90|nr:DUF2752 domain-containing protein [Flavobacterium sp.]
MKLDDYMIPCMNKSVFGLDCLGCGTQRALLLVFNGEFLKAFYMFPAIYTTIAFFVVLALNFIDKSRNYHKIIVTLAILNALIMIISYFYKFSNL